jgi:hypothetical protein
MQAEDRGSAPEAVDEILKIVIEKVFVYPYDDSLLVHLQTAAKFCHDKKLLLTAEEAEAMILAGKNRIAEALEKLVIFPSLL